jgi:outer membrane receptor protein involved in Fe transport
MASNYGVELEVKKSFKDVFKNAFLDRLSLNLNASYIFSEVDLGSDDLVQDRLRPLQGQSPYIINTSLEYADEKGFAVNLAFNRFGDRIFSVGSDNFPSVLEQSRNQMDLSISKKFKSVTVKATAQNLLDAAFKFYDDTNRDFKIKDQDDVLTSKYKIGTLFNLNLTYDF